PLGLTSPQAAAVPTLGCAASPTARDCGVGVGRHRTDVRTGSKTWLCAGGLRLGGESAGTDAEFTWPPLAENRRLGDAAQVGRVPAELVLIASAAASCVSAFVRKRLPFGLSGGQSRGCISIEVGLRTCGRGA